MIKAFLKWMVIGIITAIIFILTLENILPKSELTSAFIGFISLVILCMSLVLAIIQVKLIFRPPSVDAKLNKFERFIFSVNSLLGNFSGGYQSGKESVGGADPSPSIVDSFKKGRNVFGSINDSSKPSSNNKVNANNNRFNTTVDTPNSSAQLNELIEPIPPIVSKPAKVDSFKAKNVVALSGAVVTWYEDGMMKYLKKCDTCSTVDQSEHYTQAPMPGSSLDTYFFCNKCRKDSKLIIKAV